MLQDAETLANIEAIKAEINKAAETIATNTFSPGTRSIFSPENLDEKIKLLVPVDTPLRNRFPRVPGLGQAAAWKVMTSKLHSNVADSGTATTIFFADAGAPSETSQTYTSTSATYKLLGRKIEVGGLHLAASRNRDSQPDVMTSRERIKMHEVMLGEEEAIISGDAALRTNEFSGLHKQISTNSGTQTFFTASGLQSDFETLFDAGGTPTVLVCHARQSRALADDLEKSGAIQRIIVGNQSGATGGLRLSKIVNNVDGSLVDVVVSRYIGATGLLLTERSPAGENWIEMDDLIPMSRIDVPSSNYSFISFIVQGSVLKLIGEPFQFKYAGMATS